MPAYDDIFRDEGDEDGDGGDSGNESEDGSEPSGKRRRYDEVRGGGKKTHTKESVQSCRPLVFDVVSPCPGAAGGRRAANRKTERKERVGGAEVKFSFVSLFARRDVVATFDLLMIVFLFIYFFPGGKSCLSMNSMNIMAPR